LGNLTTPLGITGYGIVYEPYGNSLAGDIRLERFGPPSTFNSLGALNVTLTPGNQYTFTLETSGSSIVGSLWDVGQVGTSLVGQVSATDAVYASGSVGLFAVTQAPIPTVDTTFDNVVVMTPEVVVLSSSQAATGYVLDTTASINKVTKTITVPQSGTARFYRLQGANQTTITSTTVVGANVVMTYQ
jgi:hypothetical protein